MSETISVTEAARNFSDVVNRVFYRGESMELVRGNKIVARLVPARLTAPTGRDLARAWKSLSHLSQEEAEAFAADVESSRNPVNSLPSSKWD